MNDTSPASYRQARRVCCALVVFVFGTMACDGEKQMPSTMVGNTSPTPFAPPTGPRASDFVPTPFVPIDDIPWPDVGSEGRSVFERGLDGLRATMAQYQAADKLDPSSAQFRAARNKADVALLRALAALERVSALRPELGMYHLHSVQTALLQNNPHDARRRINRWLGHHPDDFDHLFLLGQVEHGAHRWPAALEALEKAAALRPTSIECRHWLAEVYFQTGQAAKGVATVREGLALLGYPHTSAWKQPMAKRFLGNAVRVLHRFQEYETLAELAEFYLERHPDEVEVKMARGVALLHTGDYEAAIPYLEAARGGERNRGEVVFALAQARLKSGAAEQAVAESVALLLEDPYFARAYYGLGLALARLGHRDTAEIAFAQSRALAPSERELRRALELQGIGEPGKAAATRALGYKMRGDYARAEEALRLRHLQNEAAGVTALADLYLESLRVDEAERVIAQLSRVIGVAHLDFRVRRTLVRYLRGEKDLALREFHGLLGKKPGLPWRVQMALMLMRDGRYADVERVLAPVPEVRDSAEASQLLGAALLRLDGREADALAALRRIGVGDKRRGVWRTDLLLAEAIARAGTDAELQEAVRLQQGAGLDRGLEFVRARSALYERGAYPPPEPESPARLRALVTTSNSLTEKIETLRDRVAKTPWPSSAPVYVELAELLHRAQRDAEALQFARLALLAAPKNTRALVLLDQLLAPDPGAAFLRWRALRQLVEARAGDRYAEALKAISSKWQPGS